MKKNEFEAKVIEALEAPCYGFQWNHGSVNFQTDADITLRALTRLSEALGTDAINFNLGDDGEPGYSSWTPGISGHAGCIQVIGNFLDEGKR